MKIVGDEVVTKELYLEGRTSLETFFRINRIHVYISTVHLPWKSFVSFHQLEVDQYNLQPNHDMLKSEYKHRRLHIQYPRSEMTRLFLSKRRLLTHDVIPAKYHLPLFLTVNGPPLSPWHVSLFCFSSPAQICDTGLIILSLPSNRSSHLSLVNTGIATSRCLEALDPVLAVAPHPTAIDVLPSKSSVVSGKQTGKT